MPPEITWQYYRTEKRINIARKGGGEYAGQSLQVKEKAPEKMKPRCPIIVWLNSVTRQRIKSIRAGFLFSEGKARV